MTARAAQVPGDTPERQATARALFEEGLQHLQAEHWAEAAERFERAYALRPSPEIGYNLSSALVRLGRLVRASELLRQVLQSPQSTDKVRAAADARLQQVLPRLAKLTVELADGSPGLAVRLDGQPLDRAMLGVAIPVDPGSHRVELLRGGNALSARAISVGEGGAAAVRLEASATGAPPPAPAAPMPSAPEPPAAATISAAPAPVEESGGGGGSRWWLWTLIGVAVAGAAVGVALAARPGAAKPEMGTAGTIYIGKGP
jgi:hypothetical protein